ncbi:hypothetical protein GCK32_012604, partial [Trichostrongylus colubriformis]
MEILGSIHEIKGRLIITNNTVLHDFHYFSSLEKVHLTNGAASNVAIIVKDNPHLASLSFPKLEGISFDGKDPRVELDNNPRLFQTRAPPSSSGFTRLEGEDKVVSDDSLLLSATESGIAELGS